MVTSRAIPTATHNSNNNKENILSPSVGSASIKPSLAAPSFYGGASFLESAAGPSRSKKVHNRKSPISYTLHDNQKRQ